MIQIKNHHQIIELKMIINKTRDNSRGPVYLKYSSLHAMMSLLKVRYRPSSVPIDEQQNNCKSRNLISLVVVSEGVEAAESDDECSNSDSWLAVAGWQYLWSSTNKPLLPV